MQYNYYEQNRNKISRVFPQISQPRIPTLLLPRQKIPKRQVRILSDRLPQLPKIQRYKSQATCYWETEQDESDDIINYLLQK
ncbi:hypothetical protein pb186bvf_003431 [Paramecium bursaria]